MVLTLPEILKISIFLIFLSFPAPAGRKSRLQKFSKVVKTIVFYSTLALFRPLEPFFAPPPGGAHGKFELLSFSNFF